MTDITVKNVDVPMLRSQRDALVAAIIEIEEIADYEAVAGNDDYRQKQVGSLQGVVNLLDAMLDNAEGFGD